jgi:4'-phosphopantetheinyl transferase
VHDVCDIYWAGLGDLAPHHLALLDAVETGRRDAYLRAEDRARFALGGVLLRLVVASRLGVAPEAVRVDRTCPGCGEPHGRPRIPGAELHVSVTHSGDFAVIAATAAGPVGVDLEAVRTFEHQPLLDDVLAPSEHDGDTSLEAFFCYWTRKESVLKATGAGLAIPMHTLEVTPPAQPPRLLRYPRTLEARMTDLAPAPGYAGAATVLTHGQIAFRPRDGSALLQACGDSFAK